MAKNNKQPPKTKAEMNIEIQCRKYTREWDITSAHFGSHGSYEWMCSHVEGRNLLLEIGCGNGNSTVALAKGGHRVIAIEQNVECVKKAKRACEEAGFSVSVVKRGKIVSKSPTDLRYSIEYSRIRQLPTDTVVIVEGDIIEDPELISFLRTLKFDAVVCWLIGTHSAMALKSSIKLSETPTPRHYRFKVQNRVYEIADEILKAEGILHIVDRGQTPDTQELENNVMESHREQASVTSLVPTILDYLPYDEPSTEGGVGMVHVLMPNEEAADPNNLSFISVVSVKP